MTATLEYAAPIKAIPPTVTCPACHQVAPHATVCRLCGGDMPDTPFCFACRTWTAPIDKTTCIKVGEGVAGAAQYALRGCPHCKNMPSDDFLKNVGMLMTAWADEVGKANPAAPPTPASETVFQPCQDLPIRVKTVQTGMVMSQTVEYDVPGMGSGKVYANDPLAKFLLWFAERYDNLWNERNFALAQRDEASRDRDELKAMLEEKTKPEKKGK